MKTFQGIIEKESVKNVACVFSGQWVNAHIPNGTRNGKVRYK